MSDVLLSSLEIECATQINRTIFELAEPLCIQFQLLILQPLISLVKWLDKYFGYALISRPTCSIASNLLRLIF